MGTYIKAIVAALTAFVSTVVVESVNGSMTLHNWFAAILAGLLSLGTVYMAPKNRQTVRTITKSTP